MILSDYLCPTSFVIENYPVHTVDTVHTADTIDMAYPVECNKPQTHTAEQLRHLHVFKSTDSYEADFDIFNAVLYLKKFMPETRLQILAMYAFVRKLTFIFHEINIENEVNKQLLYYCCFILAHKVIDDEAYDLKSFHGAMKPFKTFEKCEKTNTVIARVKRPVSFARLCEMEIALLKIFDFNVSLHPKDMQKIESLIADGYIQIGSEFMD